MDNLLVKKIPLSKNDFFYFSRKYDETLVDSLLVEAKTLNSLITGIPVLPGFVSQFEYEVKRRLIYATLALEGNPLSEKEVEEIISTPKHVQFTEKSKIEVMNLSAFYENINMINFSFRHLHLDDDWFKKIHLSLTTGIKDKDNIPGEYRHRTVKVGNKEHGGTYIPPKNFKDIQRLMTEYVCWINDRVFLQLRDGRDIIRAALAHYHLGLIHPFGDGNGRTARIFEALLMQFGGIKYAPLMLSNYYYRHMDDYYWAFSLSNKNKEKDVTPFLEFVLHGLIDSLKEIKEKIINSIRILSLKEYFSSLRAEKKVTLRQYDFLQLLLQHPSPFTFFDAVNTAPFSIITRPVNERTVRRDLDKLFKMNLLIKSDNGKYALNLRVLG